MEEGIQIGVWGTQEAIDSLNLREKAVRKAVIAAMRGTTGVIKGETKRSFGDAGKPHRRTGHLSRTIVDEVEADNDVVTGRIGSTMPYKTGYAGILEKGGDLPEIRPKKGKFLRFVRATGMAGLAHQAVLRSGGTYKQAAKAAIKAHRRLGSSPFVFVKSVPARHQRAMPYLHPAFEFDRPRIEGRFTRAIAAAKKGMTPGTGGGGEAA